MALNSNEIFIALANQSTTGAALAGDILDEIPDTFDDAETAIADFTATGYLGEEGITLTTELSLSDFREMNRGIVRKGLDDFTGTVAYTELQMMSEEVLARKFGEDAVEAVAATADHGAQLHVSLGPNLAPIQSFAWKLKDGDARAIVLIQRGQVTNGLEATFAANSMASVPMEISAYTDDGGDNIHIYFDDGEVVSGTTTTTTTTTE